MGVSHEIIITFLRNCIFKMYLNVMKNREFPFLHSSFNNVELKPKILIQKHIKKNDKVK